MTPVLAHDNQVDALRSNAILMGQIGVGVTIRGLGPNFYDLRSGEFRFGGASAGQPLRSKYAFIDSILRVLSVGADTEVGRIAARRVIAQMHDDCAFWNGAISQLPSNPVGAAHSLPVTDVTVGGRPSSSQSCPQPASGEATITTVNFGPESLSNGNRLADTHCTVSARPTTESPLTLADLRRVRLEALAALNAVSNHVINYTDWWIAERALHDGRATLPEIPS